MVRRLHKTGITQKEKEDTRRGDIHRAGRRTEEGTHTERGKITERGHTWKGDTNEWETSMISRLHGRELHSDYREGTNYGKEKRAEWGHNEGDITRGT